MRALLDTHAFLWWITDHAQLSPRATAFIQAGTNELLLSAASGWELAVKTQLGRLQWSEPPERFIPKQMALNSIAPLPIALHHALHVRTLPGLHRDPFDRMLVAQAQVERLSIVTADPLVAQYQVKTIW